MEYLQLVLIMVIFLSLMVEVKTGGMGLGALLGLIAAGIFWASSYALGTVELYQVGIFMLGLVFVMIEILTPSIGLLGALGIGGILYSLVLAMGGNIQAFYFMLIALVCAIVIFALIMKKLPSSKLWKKIVLTKASTQEQGYTSSVDYSYLEGQKGIVLTELRPAGSAEIMGKRQDVVSQGEYIPKDAMIVVIKVEGNRIIVKAI